MAEAAKDSAISRQGTETERETELEGVFSALRNAGASRKLALSILDHWLSNEAKIRGSSDV